MAYCRIPEHIIKNQHDEDLVILNVEHSTRYHVPLHLALPKADKTGSAASYLYDLLLASVCER